MIFNGLRTVDKIHKEVPTVEELNKSKSKYSFFVYYDPNYTTSWIPHGIAEQLANILVNRGFKHVKADELKSEIIKRIQSKNADKCIIVFVQDVVPDTVFDRFEPTCLIRQFIERGGTIIWFGDIPFWHRGLKHYKHTSDLFKIDTEIIDKTQVFRGNYLHVGGIRHATLNLLGVVPIITFSSTNTVELTEKAKNCGLNTKWTSHRPVLYPEENKDFEVLAYTTIAIGVPVPTKIGIPGMGETSIYVAIKEVPIEKKGIKRAVKWLKRISAIQFAMMGTGFGISFAQPAIREIPLPTYEKLPAAWIKYIGDGMLIRLWDEPWDREYLLEEYKDRMAELLKLINKILEDKKT